MNREQILRAAEWAAFLAKLDDGLGGRGANAGKLLKLVDGCGVQVDWLGRRSFLSPLELKRRGVCVFTSPLAEVCPYSVWVRLAIRAEGRDFVSGKHKFPSDITRPGMMYGAVLRPDGFSATLSLVDTTGVGRVLGAKLVQDGDFIGVVAPDAYSAQKALASIEARWQVPEQPSNDGLFQYLKSNPEPGSDIVTRPGIAARRRGSHPGDAPAHLTRPGEAIRSPRLR